MNKILYLDFDGVLHNSEVYVDKSGEPYYLHSEVLLGCELFQFAKYLEVPDNISIILSTSWANNHGSSTNWAKARMPKHLANKVIGRTKDVWNSSSYFDELPRGRQVELHVKQFCVTDYLAIDDNIDGFDLDSDSFIRTDPEWGICSNADEINARLLKMSLI